MSGLLNRGSIADLSLLRTLLAIGKKSWEPGFWEVMNLSDSLAFASFAALTTHLQQLLACVNFTLDSKDLFSWYKTKKVISKNLTAAQGAENHGDEAWPDTCNEAYIHQFKPELTHKIN